MNINLTLIMQAVAFTAFIWFTATVRLAAADARHRDAAEADRRRPRRRRAGPQEPRQRREARSREMLTEAKTPLRRDHRAGREVQDRDDRAGEGRGEGRGRPHPRRRQGRDRAGGRAREGAAARPGRRPRRRRRVEDPEARGRRQGARRPARLDPAAALTGRAMAELTTIARPYARSGVRARARGQRAAGPGRRCCAREPRSSPTPQVAAALDNPKLTAGGQGVAAAVDLRRQARRRAAATSCAC